MSAVPDLVVVPVGGANFGSLARAFERVGATPRFSAEPADLRRASHVVLPGVGAAAAAMPALRSQRLAELLAGLRVPLLGICLGMQLLFEHSAEGDVTLLGLLPGRVERLPAAPSWPHMGWTTLAATAAGHGHPLLAGIDADDWFYFVHGYAVPPAPATLASADHGGAFSALVGAGNRLGVQFHPEKSAAAGRRLLRNFLDL